MHFRRLSMSTSLIFFPPISISPDTGSKNLNSNLIIVDFLKQPYNTTVLKINTIKSSILIKISFELKTKSQNIVTSKILK